jgi:hypothetical protein
MRAQSGSRDRIHAVVLSFRRGFYGGLIIVLCAGLYLTWLWQPERQVRRHTENFFKTIEHKDWHAAADFLAADYQDQWGDNRVRVLERLHESFRYVRGHESSRPIRMCRFKARARHGAAKLGSTAPTTR